MRTLFRGRRNRQNSGLHNGETQDLGMQILEHLESLFSYAVTLSRDFSLAEDLVQETFLRAIKNANRWRPHTNLKAWLFTIQRNIWINECHRQQRASEFSFSTPWGDAFGNSPGSRRNISIEEVLSEHSWVRHEVLAAVDALSPAHREVVLLRDFEGFDYKEIAKIVGVPIGTVMSRLNRARSELRKRLQHLHQRKDRSVSYERL